MAFSWNGDQNLARHTLCVSFIPTLILGRKKLRGEIFKAPLPMLFPVVVPIILF